MSEEKDPNEVYAEAQEASKEAKAKVTEARAEVKAFAKEHKVRKIAAIKDEKAKAEGEKLEAALIAAQEAYEAAKDKAAELKPKKGRGGGGGSYTYGVIKDQESGEERDPDTAEKKRWRTHARKVANKDESFAEGKDVPWDPTFFDPKPKKGEESQEGGG
jgi:hypothetical protein